MWTNKDREKYKDDGRRYPSDLTDAEWDIIEPLFRGYFTFTADMREVVNACFYLEHTGCQWRALPSNFGPHRDRQRNGGSGSHSQIGRRLGVSFENLTGTRTEFAVESGVGAASSA